VRIAIFDYRVVTTNPSGGCHRTLMAGLCREHDFTVFSVEFDNPCPDRIEWVRVPVPTRPLVLLFVLFHAVAPVIYLAHRVRRRARFDVIQHVEDNLTFGNVAYVHFCHRRFLARVWPSLRARGVRRWARWLDHRLHAILEPFVYRWTRLFVVPSTGLREELMAEYPATSGRTIVIENPIDVARFTRPSTFDRGAERRRLALSEGDIVLAFTALGHFERKGLPAVLRALVRLPSNTKLIVIGGQPDLVRQYRRFVATLAIEERVIFTGMVQDPRRYLWAADAFVFPSFYEVFSLAVHEAAAAGLPPIVTRLHGVTDVFEDGTNAIFVQSEAESVTAGVRRFLRMSDAERLAMSERVQSSVDGFSPALFVDRWRLFYQGLATPGSSDVIP
jgi:glycosyltransferase involved in cell wall biosynthesis